MALKDRLTTIVRPLQLIWLSITCNPPFPSSSISKY